MYHENRWPSSVQSTLPGIRKCLSGSRTWKATHAANSPTMTRDLGDATAGAFARLSLRRVGSSKK
jgi:hypothetical protein